ncbi:SLBB domain-containing protein [Shewanella frigidimarina]|uniref:Sugar transporter n=1 Tax=Shewanella frigidimarina TaxID=56812 RepID=A0A125BF12_SHEFR|nr:SLBB domain-containing protein [Shewanella frigidimarina]KVX03503.1 sugar transporter [Shewanella frigidimarina]
MLHKTKNILIAGLSAFIILTTQANAVTPTPQMIEQFKKLSKSDQEKLASQYGIDPSMLSDSKNSSDRSDRMANPNLVNPREDSLNGEYDYDSEQDSSDKRNKDRDRNKDRNKKNEYDFRQDSDKDELKRFGYDMFEGEPTTFAPVTDVPIPSDYMVGPGDIIKLQLYGKESKEYSLTINRDGTIQIPDLGPVSVVGLSFANLRLEVSKRIKQQMIGVESNISMGELRSIRIFIAGDAYKPGSYTVSSLSTITQALFVAGGVNEIGSLRNVQVKRSGKLIGSFDLYDLLLRGDASGDINLRSGDVVFIPSIGGLVSVAGEVRRPAIYELKKNETIANVISMAAGVTQGAYPKNSSIERYNANGLKTIINVDLTSENGNNTLAKAGDYVRVKSASSQYEDAITIIGAVVRPGKYQWKQQRISDVLPSIWGDLLISADLDYGLIVREINKHGDIETLQFSPGEAITSPGSSENLTLQPRDKVMIFNYNDDSQNRFELNALVKKRVSKVELLRGDSLLDADLFKVGFETLDNTVTKKYTSEIAGVALAGASLNEEQLAEETLVGSEVAKMLSNLFEDRDLIKLSYVMSRKELLYPIVTKLTQQGNARQGIKIVAIAGKIRHPGLYPLTNEAKVTDLLKAAGGLLEGAYTERAELTRTHTTSAISDIIHKQINLFDAINGSQQDNLTLQGRDMVTILTTPEWQERKIIEIKGEVKFPGTYNIRRGEQLSDVVARAGGFTEFAYPQAAVFVRESVRMQEELEIKKLADQLRRDLATRGVSKDGTTINYTEAQLMLSDLEGIKAVGRLVVDLNAIKLGIAEADLQLEDNDVLYVPTIKQTVAVMGEVQNPSTQRFKKGLTLDDYLLMSGGPRERGDDGRVYVIKADGSVMMPTTNLWFSSNSQISAGDTIIVPLDTEYKDNLTLWSQVTQIIYNSAVALASISAL